MADPAAVQPVYVLRDALTGRCFVRMTAIGPMGGTRAEAQEFPSEQAAMQSPAFSFALTFYRPELVFRG